MNRKYLLKKGFDSFLLAILFLLVSSWFNVDQNHSYAARFQDTSGHWAESYIDRASSMGITNGYTDGTFRPNTPVTRAEFAGMVNRTLGNYGTTSITYPDVRYGSWYYNDVAKAVAATYVAGYADGYFRPNDFITRQEVAVMIERFVPTSGYESNLRGYPDAYSVASWANSAFSKVCNKGYLGPYKNDNLLHPTDSLTRAQAAKILCDIKDKERIYVSDPLSKGKNATISNAIYSNNLTVNKDSTNSDTTLDNCIVLGSLLMDGGNGNSVDIKNSRIVKGVVSGNSANVTMRNGSLVDLTLDSSSKNSEVTVYGDATITNVSVNAAASFYGSGKINYMRINSSDVTYETKPATVSIASNVSDSNDSSTSNGEATFKPRNKASNVSVDTDITITFDSAMTLYNGRTITSSDIEDFVTLRRGSSRGTSLSFSGSISSNKKIITIEPSKRLDKDERYYITIDKNAMKDSKGYGNSSLSSYFDTGTGTGNNYSEAFIPSNGAVSVDLDQVVRLNFDGEVVRYSNGDTISTYDSFLKDCVEFRKDGATGEKIEFSPKINSDKDSITLEPDQYLEPNRTYYVAIVGNRLKYASDGTMVSPKNVTWRTGGLPLLSDFGVSTSDRGQTTLTVKGSSNVNGTLYAVAVTGTSGVPTADQVVSGRNSNGVSVPSGSVSIGGGGTAQIKLSGLAIETNYSLYGVIRDRGGNLSTVGSSSGTTLIGALSGLTITPLDHQGRSTGSLAGFSFNSGVFNYGSTDDYGGSSKIWAPNGSKKILITPVVASDSKSTAIVTIGGIRAMDGYGTTVDMQNWTAANVGTPLTMRTFTVEYCQGPGKTTTTYTINVYEKGSAGFSSMTVNGTPNSFSLNSFAGSTPSTTLSSNANNNLDLSLSGGEGGANVIISQFQSGTWRIVAEGPIGDTGSVSFQSMGLSFDDQTAPVKISITSKDRFTTADYSLDVLTSVTPLP